VRFGAPARSPASTCVARVRWSLGFDSGSTHVAVDDAGRRDDGFDAVDHPYSCEVTNPDDGMIQAEPCAATSAHTNRRRADPQGRAVVAIHRFVPPMLRPATKERVSGRLMMAVMIQVSAGRDLPARDQSPSWRSGTIASGRSETVSQVEICGAVPMESLRVDLTPGVASRVAVRTPSQARWSPCPISIGAEGTCVCELAVQTRRALTADLGRSSSRCLEPR